MVKVDFSKKIGKIKPMHCVNNVPFVPYNKGQNDLYLKMQEAGIPYTRLHDTGGTYGGRCFVDIANVFPNFEADPSDPNSYDFAFTDRLLSEIVKYNIKPFYRLGASIENDHHIKAYNIYPPADNLKWAKICEGIIRHYNEGWANGFNYNIEYWEIWNEPDNEPEIENNPMWKGTLQQYFELYKTTALYLKEKFPHLKIGGYSSCGFYALKNIDISNVAHSTPRTEYFIEFFHKFMKYVKENNLPLDFFSWHSYGDVKENIFYTEYVHEQLSNYGYTNTEIILNEWNPGIRYRGTLRDATNIAAMFCAMQKSHNDMCMYYDAQIRSNYCGLFNPLSKDVFKAYYSFVAFNELYKLKYEVQSSCDKDEVYVCAASNNGKGAIMVVNRTNEIIKPKIALKGLLDYTNVSVLVINNNHDLEEVCSFECLPNKIGFSKTMEIDEVMLIKLNSLK